MGTKPNWALLAGIVALAVTGCGTILSRVVTSPDGSVATYGGPDDVFMMQGIERIKTFAETLQWWHGPWAFYPHNAYYRPIPSILFWIELHWTGWHALREVSYLHVLWHVCCAVLLFLFLRYLLDELTAFVATALWCLSAPEWLGLVGAKWALVDWICGTDIWMSIAMILTLWAWLAYVRQGRFYWLALTCIAYTAAICCKEIGYLTLPFMGAILWFEGRLHESWRSLAWPLIVAFGMLIVRYVSVYQLHGHMGEGSNGSWLRRLAMDLFGISGATFSGDLLPLVIAGLLFGCALLLSGQRAEALATILVGLCFFAVTPWVNHETISNELLRCIGSVMPYSYALLAIVQWAFVRRYFTAREKAATLGLMWAAALYVTALVAVYGRYGFYLQSAGWCIWLSVPIANWLRIVQVAISKQYAARIVNREFVGNSAGGRA